MVDLPASAVLNSGPVHQAVLNALDQLGLAVLVKDLSSGRYVYANGVASRLLHAGDDQLEGALDADIFDATQAVALRAADVQARQALGCTAANAATSALAEQPTPVTRVIQGWPLASTAQAPAGPST